MTSSSFHTPQDLLTTRGVKLYKWAGWLLVSICSLHFVFWTVVTWDSWGAWATGGLWKKAARKKERLPGYVAWGLTLWVLACSLMLEPSGFPLGLAPCVLLLLAQRKVRGVSNGRE